MKYARHGVALIIQLYLFFFCIDWLGIYINRVLKGVLIFIYLFLESMALVST